MKDTLIFGMSAMLRMAALAYDQNRRECDNEPEKYLTQQWSEISKYISK